MCFYIPVSDMPKGTASSLIVALPRAEPFEHGAPGRVGEGRKRAVDARWILNHWVRVLRGSVRKGNSVRPGHTSCVVTDTVAWWAWLVPLAVAGPWIVGIVYYWHRRVRDGAIPMSMADEARRRLWLS